MKPYIDIATMTKSDAMKKDHRLLGEEINKMIRKMHSQTTKAMETTYPVRDRIEYIIAFINEFAQHFGLSDAQAYRYLRTYGAITNINKHYGALHKL